MILSNNKIYRVLDFSEYGISFPYLFICDHATNNIPNNLNYLGLSQRQLSSHICWDIGAKELTVKLAQIFKCPCFFSNFSRLVIDPNRKKNSYDLIVSSQDGNNIPGNENLTESDLNNRFLYYLNYHKNLNAFIENCRKRNKEFKLVSLHSFNQNCFNESRSIEVGILYNYKNIKFALQMFETFEKLKICYGNNYPYSGFFYNFTLDEHSKENNLGNICIEVRNDLIVQKKGIDKWSEILKIALNNYDKR